MRNYRNTHKEYMRVYCKKWREDNHEELKKKKAKYYLKNKIRIAKKSRQFYISKRDYLIKHNTEYGTKRGQEAKIQVFTHYSKGKPKCNCCGESGSIQFLTIDHINGRDKTKKRLTGQRLYLDILKKGFPKDYQVLCWNCNCTKGFMGGCCHKKEYNFPNDAIGRYKKLCIKHYSNNTMKCKCCSETILGFLTIDHINNNGSKHKKEIKQSKMYKWLVDNNYPKGFQVLCFNCNSGRNLSKDKQCPHNLILNTLHTKTKMG